jgi:alpha-L-arabinofuranosidase
MELSLEFEGFSSLKVLEETEIYSDDLRATNTKDEERVAPAKKNTFNPETNTVTLKKHSFNMLRLSY